MELIKMDVLDEGLAGIIATGQYDAIVHLAGQTLVSHSLEEPDFDAESNIIGLIRVLEAARQSGVRRVVFSSTAAAYGDVPERDLPIKEAHKLAPMSFYGLSKVTAERYLELDPKAERRQLVELLQTLECLLALPLCRLRLHLGQQGAGLGAPLAPVG